MSYLDLDSNKLVGMNSEMVFVNLVMLFCSYLISVGTIPSAITCLTSLLYLNIAANLING